MKNIKPWLYVGGIIVLVVAALVAVQISATPKAAVSRFTLNAPGAGLSAQPAAQDVDSPVGPQVSYSIRNDVSAPLSSIPVIPPRQEIMESDFNQLPNRGSASALALTELDGALQQGVLPSAIPGTSANFAGVGNVNSVLPPDTEGDVGPNHYMQWVNLSFAIYNKDGALLYGPAAGNTLWSGLGGPCQTSNNGDPIVQYDHLANRWMVSQFALPGGANGYHQCIAVSVTPDPTGAWHRYDFLWSSTKMNDYPHFGVWPDGYYMSVNQFNNGVSWGGQGVAVFERDAMLWGLPARMIKFDKYADDPNLGGMLPSDLDGQAPPAGAPNAFVEMDDNSSGVYPDQLQVWNFHTDWATPANSTFTHATDLLTAAFNGNLCAGQSNPRNCVPQAGTNQKLDAIGDRLMYRLQYRNFGAHQTLVLNHTVDATGAKVAAPRWYELRNTGAGWSIYQQSTFSPDAQGRWMASAAMDGEGNIALGYSISSATTFPSIYYTGRLAGDPLNSMTLGEGVLFTGTGAQTHTAARWGDYSMMAVDPNGCTFWYTNEYLETTGSAPWLTRIGSFNLPGCNSGTLSGTVTDASTSLPISGVTVIVAGQTAQTNGSGFYTVAVVPVGSYTVTAAKTGYHSGTATNVGITDGNTTTRDFALTPAGCTDKCLRVVSITMSKTFFGVRARVTVKDEHGVAVPSARVYVHWDLPAGTKNMNKLTNSTGVAAFSVSGGNGAYTITVTDITKSTFTFDAANSTLLTKSFIK